MKVYWTVYYGEFRQSEYTFQGRNSNRKSEYTFQGQNAKRDAQRLAKRLGGRVVREKGQQ